MSILGHELEHAVEIADHPWVVDERGMSALYTAIGLPRDQYAGHTFDTSAAITAGERIRRELLSVAGRAAAAAEMPGSGDGPNQCRDSVDAATVADRSPSPSLR